MHVLVKNSIPFTYIRYEYIINSIYCGLSIFLRVIFKIVYLGTTHAMHLTQETQRNIQVIWALYRT